MISWLPSEDEIIKSDLVLVILFLEGNDFQAIGEQ